MAICTHVAYSLALASFSSLLPLSGLFFVLVRPTVVKPVDEANPSVKQSTSSFNNLAKEASHFILCLFESSASPPIRSSGLVNVIDIPLTGPPRQRVKGPDTKRERIVKF